MSTRASRIVRRLVARLSPAIFVRIFWPTDPELGVIGEEVAARHLRSKGIEILGRRVASDLGEIDILARDGSTNVCVEVKSGRVEPKLRRKGEPRELDLRWRPGLRVDRARLARLRRCARSLRTHGASSPRVDLVEVLLDVEARNFVVVHHAGLREPLRNAPAIPQNATDRRGFHAGGRVRPILEARPSHAGRPRPGAQGDPGP